MSEEPDGGTGWEPAATTADDPGDTLTRAQVLEIASAAALQAYDDLAVYTVTASREDDGWHVDYDLTDPESLGGGPHFVIDAASGEITARRYEQ